jgi:hypothetical protein
MKQDYNAKYGARKKESDDYKTCLLFSSITFVPKYFLSDQYFSATLSLTLRRPSKRRCSSPKAPSNFTPFYQHWNPSTIVVIFRGIKHHDNTCWSFRVIPCVQKDGRILTGAPWGMEVTLKPSTKESGSAPRVTTWSQAYDLLPPPCGPETSAASSAYNTNSHDLNTIFAHRYWRCNA